MIVKLVAKQFGKPSGILGYISTLIMNIMNRRLYKFTEERLDIKLGDKILDIGFGNGNLIKGLIRKNKDLSIYGVDISEDMVNKFPNIERVEVTIGNVNNLKYREDYFDKIYTINTIYFWDDLKLGLEQINKVLKSGGVFLLIGYEKDWLNKIPYTKHGFNKYTKEDILSYVQESGLVVEKFEVIQEKKSYCVVIKKL